MTEKDKKQKNQKPNPLSISWVGDIPDGLPEHERKALIEQIVENRIAAEEREAAEWDAMTEEKQTGWIADVCDSAPDYPETVEEFVERVNTNQKRALKPDSG